MPVIVVMPLPCALWSIRLCAAATPHRARGPCNHTEIAGDAPDGLSAALHQDSHRHGRGSIPTQNSMGEGAEVI